VLATKNLEYPIAKGIHRNGIGLIIPVAWPVILESGVNFSGFCKKQPENEIPATFFAAVDEILKYSHPIISRFEPVAQV
jgi:hypothetical protein